LKQAREQRTKLLNAIAVCNQDNDGDRQGRKVLLVLQVLIGGQDRVEQCSGSTKKLTVFETGPHPISCTNRTS